MAFSVFPYLIVSTTNPSVGISANLPIIGSQLSMQPYLNNFQAMWNIDFNNGLIALAMTGNTLVIHAPNLTDSTTPTLPEALILQPVEENADTQWEISANPGPILARHHPTLAITGANGGAQNEVVNLDNLYAAPKVAQKWMLVQLTALSSADFKSTRMA